MAQPRGQAHSGSIRRNLSGVLLLCCRKNLENRFPALIGGFGFKDNPSQTRFLAFQSKVGWILALGFGEKDQDEFPSIQITRTDDARKWFKQFEDAAVAAESKQQQTNP